MSYLIGSIDGGGLMGVGAVKLLTRLMVDTKESIQFDGYSGTSTGSIIAAALAMGYPAYKVLELYEEMGKKIFSKRYWLPNRPKYSNKPLIKILKRVFGDVKMSKVQRPLYIGYSDFTTGRTSVFSRANDIDVWKAVLISCSAPTYFEPVDNRFFDGGLVLQNPSFIGAVEFSDEMNIPLKEVSVLSFGTNGKTDKPIKVNKNQLKIQTAIACFRFCMEASEDLSNTYCKKTDLNGFMRLEPFLDKKYKMDSPKIIEPYQEVWDKLYDRERTNILKFIESVKGVIL